MKGKSSIRIRLAATRTDPNVPKKVQKWRYYFESFAKIDKEHDVKIGKRVLHIEPVSNEKIKGYYEFSFLESRYINRKKAEDIAKKDFDYYDKVFALKGYFHFSPKWKKLVCINAKQFIKPQIRSFNLGIKYSFVPPHFSNDLLWAFPSLLQRIEKSDQREQVIQCLDWMNKETKSDIERFLFMWISFNILYSTKYPTSTDTEAIESFSQYGIEYSKIEQLLEDHEDIIKKLIELKLISKNKKVNHSKELKKVFKKKKKKDILKHSLLCAWRIRGDLFHKGKRHDIFLGNLANYLQEVIKLGLLKII